MAAPSGTCYPSGLDTAINLGSAYTDPQSSALLAIKAALAVNPQGSDASVAAVPMERMPVRLPRKH